jgi:hypothetical protein
MMYNFFSFRGCKLTCIWSLFGTPFFQMMHQKTKKTLANCVLDGPKRSASKGPRGVFLTKTFFRHNSKSNALRKMTCTPSDWASKDTHFQSHYMAEILQLWPYSPIIYTWNISPSRKKWIISKSFWASAIKKTQPYVSNNGAYTELGCDR